MRACVKQNMLRSYPRELAIAITMAGLAALYILAIGDAIGPREDRLSPSDFPESTQKKVGRARVKIVRLNNSGVAERLPLATGFIVATSWENGDDHIYVLTRLSNLGVGTNLAICFFPFVPRATVYGPPNVCSAEIVCADNMRDLALLHGVIQDQSFDCEPLVVADVGIPGRYDDAVYCEGFVKEGIWKIQSYGKSHLLLARIVAVHAASTPPASGLPEAELVEVSSYAPIDRSGMLSGAPVVNRSGNVIGIWMDRQPYSRFFLSAGEVRGFLKRNDFDPANPSLGQSGRMHELSQ